MATHRQRWDAFLTTAVVITSTFIGSTLFARIDEGLSGPWKWVLGTVGVATAAAAGLQKSLNWGEVGERHRVAGARWDEIFNQLCVLVTQFEEQPPPRAELDKIEALMSALVKESPTIPQRRFKDAGLDVIYKQLAGDLPPDDCEAGRES